MMRVAASMSFPPPRGEGLRVGGRESWRRESYRLPSSTPTPPHKGEGLEGEWR